MLKYGRLLMANCRRFANTQHLYCFPDDTKIICPSESFMGKLSDEEKSQISVIQKEYEALQNVATPLPTEITDDQWLTLLKSERSYVRLRHLHFLYKKERYRKKQHEKNVKKREGFMDFMLLQENKYNEMRRKAQNQIVYGAGFNNLFCSNQIERRISSVEYARWAVHQWAGCPRVVFDLCWLKNTMDQVRSLTLIQLQYSYTENRQHRSPFELSFANVDTNAKWWQDALNSQLKLMNYKTRTPSSVVPCSVTEKSYLDLYPKERLVYLSPDSPNLMEKFDANNVYIIGALVDKFDRNLMGSKTLEKAESEGIRTERLPLKEFGSWHRGSLLLPINQVLLLLLNVQHDSNWTRAIKGIIPKRKLSEPSEDTPQNRIKNRKVKASTTFRLSVLEQLKEYDK